MTTPREQPEVPDGPPVGAEVLFELVVPRYMISLQRFETGQARVLQIGTFVPAAFFAATAFVANAAAAPDFQSAWLIWAAIFATASTVVCWVARFAFADLKMPDLTQMYGKHYYAVEPDVLRAWFVSWAGRDADWNAKVIERLYYAALWAIIAFALSMGLLLIWAAQQL